MKLSIISLSLGLILINFRLQQLFFCLIKTLFHVYKEAYPMIGPTAPGFSWLLAQRSEMLVRVTLITFGVPGGAG